MGDTRDRSAVVLVGHDNDEHSDELQALLLQRGRVSVVRWARDKLPKAAVSFIPGGAAQVEKTSVGPYSAAGFWRRPSWPALSQYAEVFGDFATDECVDAFDGAMESLGISWLTEPQALRRAELKIYQLTTAVELGFPIPKTIVTNSSETAETFARRIGRVVVKPVRYGLLSREPEPRVAFATEVSSKDLRNLDGPPVIVQELIEALTHLRVVTAASVAFASELRTEAIDWRSDLENHQRFEMSKGQVAKQVQRQALAIAKRLSLGYSSQDWILAKDGRLVFLEANPNGQWLFLDDLWHGRITRAIAETLERLARRARAGGNRS